MERCTASRLLIDTSDYPSAEKERGRGKLDGNREGKRQNGRTERKQRDEGGNKESDIHPCVSNVVGVTEVTSERKGERD